jgi:hypothetical protein
MAVIDDSINGVGHFGRVALREKLALVMGVDRLW